MPCPICHHPLRHDLDQALQAEKRPKNQRETTEIHAKLPKNPPHSNILTNNINQICHAKKMLRKTILLSPIAQIKEHTENWKPKLETGNLSLNWKSKTVRKSSDAKPARNYRKIHPNIRHIIQQYQYNIFCGKMLRKTPATGPRLCRYPPTSRPNFRLETRNFSPLPLSLFTFHFPLFTFFPFPLSV